MLEACKDGDLPIMEFDGTIKQLGNRLLSANAYLGAEPMVEALNAGADIVITGRAADPALFLAPRPRVRLGDGRLEDARPGHRRRPSSGMRRADHRGLFCRSRLKDVPRLARLGFPIGEVGEDGELVVTKVAGSGGAVTAQTCKEQLLDEIHDPTKYFQPDVVADFSKVRVEEIAPDRVRVGGGGGAGGPKRSRSRSATSTATSAKARFPMPAPARCAWARLALEIVRERLRLTGVLRSEARFDLIGVDALHGAVGAGPEPDQVRVRVAGRTESSARGGAHRQRGRDALHRCPAAGGGVTK